MTSQWVRFVGGIADGLSERVPEIAPGKIPPSVEYSGSTYLLVWPEGRVDAEYHIIIDR